MAGKLGIVTNDLAQEIAHHAPNAYVIFMGDCRISADGDRLSRSSGRPSPEPLVRDSNHVHFQAYGSWTYSAFLEL